MFKWFVIAGLILLCSCQGGQSRKVSSLNDYNTHQFDEFIKDISKQEPFFGNILVKKEGKVLLERSYGMANIEWQQKNNRDSKFFLASVSKQFTAAAIYQLVREGKLSYDDPLSKFIPFRGSDPKKVSHYQKITIRDLVAHKAGLLKDLQADFVDMNKKYKLSELIERLLQDERLLTKSYGQFYYSNVGYKILARVVEVVTKFDFDMYLSFKLFRKLKMTNSGVYHRSKIIPHMASGYYRNEDDKFGKFCCYDNSVNMGSHNLYSTTHDLALWVEELTDKNKVMGKDFLSFEEKPARGEAQYFNGLFKKQEGENTHYWHDGFSGGYATRLSFFPEKDLVIIILLNRVNVFTAQTQIEKIHQKLVEVY